MKEDYKLDLDESEKVAKIDRNTYGLRAKGVKTGKREDGKFKYVYMPQIEVNHKMSFIEDKSYASGFVECETEEEAINIAQLERNRLLDRQRGR